MEGLGLTRGQSQLGAYAMWLPDDGCPALTDALGAAREVEAFGVGVGVDCDLASPSLASNQKCLTEERSSDATPNCAWKDPKGIELPRLDVRVELNYADRRAGFLLGDERRPGGDGVGRERKVAFPEVKLLARVAPMSLGREGELRESFVLAGKCAADVHVGPN